VGRVWDLLTDPAVLASCLPGCERFERRAPAEAAPAGAGAGAGPTESGAGTDQEVYDVTMAIGIAAVKGRYQGQVRVSDKVPHQRYVLSVEGGGRPGFVRGQGTIQLREEGGQTAVVYRGEAQVGGTIAAVGQRMLTAVARMLAGQFFGCLERQLAAQGTPPAGADGPA
jgi:carbon monoxide dehydrogenase subunit G